MTSLKRISTMFSFLELVIDMMCLIMSDRNGLYLNTFRSVFSTFDYHLGTIIQNLKRQESDSDIYFCSTEVYLQSLKCQ